MRRVFYITIAIAVIFVLGFTSSKDGSICSKESAAFDAASAGNSGAETGIVSVPAMEPVSNPITEPFPEKVPLPGAQDIPGSAPTSILLHETDESDGAGSEEKMQLPYFRQELAERYSDYQDENPDSSSNKVIIDVNIGLDKPFYLNINLIDEPDRIDVLVNKYNKLPDDYVPDLEEIPSSLCVQGRQYLRKEAKEAFERMHFDAEELGLNITAYGTYRSISTQNEIWNWKVNSGRSIEDVDSLNSRGGHSEHHTGLAVDVIINEHSVENTEEYEWYRVHAHKYGFIIRYPKGKESITGYAYEPWHLRYIGVETATTLYESGVTYEEYCAIKCTCQKKSIVMQALYGSIIQQIR